jgi:hypothetical protein
LAYKTRVFQEDLLWPENQSEILKLLETADIIHLHNWIDLSQNKFGLDFNRYLKKGQRLIRQFHTEPGKLAKTWGVSQHEIINDSVAQLVLAQFHERYYPRARIVPNIVPIFDQDYLPSTAKAPNASCRIFFSPTSMRSAWESRWNTKGAFETIKIVEKQQKKLHFEFECISRRPHLETLSKKQASDVVIDEVVTGSYHLSTLEGLSQGKPTLAYLDNRTISTIYEVTGAISQIPIVNTQLEDLSAALKRLVEDKPLRGYLGAYSREWMEKHWSDAQMIQHYVHAYEDLINRPERFSVPRFNQAQTWLFTEAIDTAWSSRKLNWQKASKIPSFAQKPLATIRKLIASLRNKISRTD